MKRREFVRFSLFASSAIVLPFGCTDTSNNDIIGGDEKLFLSGKDIDQIRAKAQKYDWAGKRLEALKKTALATEEDYYQLHWQGTWRQWTTGQYLKSVALCYRLTGEDKNLNYIKKSLIQEFKLDKVDTPLYKADKPVSSSMWSYGVSRMNYFWAWDLMKNHPDFQDIVAPMTIRLDEMIHQYFRYEEENIKRLGNTQFWGVATLGVLGFLRSNDKAIDHAINGKHGFKAALETKLRDGKFWPEPLGYTLNYVLCAMSLLTEASRVNGYEDLYAYQSPSGATFKNVIDGLFDLCNPSGLLIANGDGSYGTHLDKEGNLQMFEGFGANLFGSKQDRTPNKFELFYKIYKDPKYAWVINKEDERYCEDVTVWGDGTLLHGMPLDEEEIPAFKSAKFQGLGHALLSTVEGEKYWEGKGNVLHIRNGNTIQFHGHDDPFHIDLYANGKMIYPDWYLKKWDYLAPRKSRNKRNMTPISHFSLGHNTVLVDKKGPDYRRYQLPQRMKEVNDIIFSEIQSSDRMKSISLEGTIYKGVNQRRTLGITSDYLVEVFECESNDVHSYDYVLHDMGSLSFDSKISFQPYDKFQEDYRLAPLDAEAKSADNTSLRAGTKGVFDEAWNAHFSDEEGKRVKLHFAAEAGTEIYETNTPLHIQGGWDNTPEHIRKMTKPMLIVRRHCKTTKFIVVHQLTNFDNKFQVTVSGDNITISTDKFNEVLTYNDAQLLLKKG